MNNYKINHYKMKINNNLKEKIVLSCMKMICNDKLYAIYNIMY